MRALVLALAVLAGAKVWVQDRYYRTATEDALIAAYRDRAAQACQKESQRALAGLPVTWAGSEAHLVIGNGALDVYAWELGHELWSARYMTPYLVLRSAAGIECSFDFGHGTAQVNGTSLAQTF